jgi:hypothetical protein
MKAFGNPPVDGRRIDGRGKARAHGAHRAARLAKAGNAPRACAERAARQEAS